MIDDPKRRQLWLALAHLADLSDPNYTRGLDDWALSQFRVSKQKDVLEAAEEFPWAELPEARYVVAMLKLCMKLIGA